MTASNSNLSPVLSARTRIFVAGHKGLAGSAIVRKLVAQSHTQIITRDKSELDLLDQTAVRNFFAQEKIEAVFLAAARVGGIIANSTYQADFLYENLVIATNVIRAAADFGVTKLMFLGSTCIYPRGAPQPMKEEYLLTGPLEATNEGYAIAKIAGLKLCEMYQRQYGKRFISVMPTNLYGPRDNFHPQNSHVIPGMMRRFHEAKLAQAESVTVWGTGKPTREFLHCDDLADGLYMLMQNYERPETINLGSGEEVSIQDLAFIMKEITGFPGTIHFDTSKPDGPLRKVSDISKVRALGWKHSHSLKEGIRSSYQWALENQVF